MLMRNSCVKTVLVQYEINLGRLLEYSTGLVGRAAATGDFTDLSLL
jgi:hypothetical protein